MSKNTSSKNEKDPELKSYGSKIYRLKCLQKSLKIVFLSALIGVFSIQLLQCVVWYWTYPTYVESEIVEQRESTFPVITICTDNGFKKDILEVTICHYIILTIF